MSWTDKASVEHIKQLRDIFKVKTFIETGTFKGINAKLHSNNFNEVLSVERIKKYYDIAKQRLKIENVHLFNMDSAEFLKDFVNRYKRENRNDYVIIYLDAHFYDFTEQSGLSQFTILNELRALKDFKNCIIVIHDFDNNLGHITYDDISLNFDLLKNDLKKINSFNYYTNELNSCDIVTKQEVIDGELDGLEPDMDTLGNLDYTWSSPRLTYRGFLYCVPSEVLVDGLKCLNT
ncbi:MAG: hypothetical protein IH948_00330 [Bacteroidetes bacterium]|nr:hypothetical protein [Bacteroidota bacterium]